MENFLSPETHERAWEVLQYKPSFIQRLFMRIVQRRRPCAYCDAFISAAAPDGMCLTCYNLTRIESEKLRYQKRAMDALSRIQNAVPVNSRIHDEILQAQWELFETAYEVEAYMRRYGSMPSCWVKSIE